MRVGSICSGIEAASLAAPDNWEFSFFSEIDKFPSAVLKHHYPDIPNLGDFTKINAQDWPDVQLLCAGTPCQTFSVAGQRKSLDDNRGNLTLKFVEAVKDIMPEWVFWENVPGVISSEGNPLEKMIGAINDAGYYCDLDILDAQHYGIPQRRKRIMLVCQNAKIGRKKKSPFFATAGATFLTEVSLMLLAAHVNQSSVSAGGYNLTAHRSEIGLIRMMKSLGISAQNYNPEIDENPRLKSWLKDWGDTVHAFPSALKNLDTTSELCLFLTDIQGEKLLGGKKPKMADDLYMNILSSWNNIWEDLLNSQSKFTTSTQTKTITQSKIYICAETVLNTLLFIINSTGLPLNYWDEASSLLTALREFIKYAKQTSNDLFGDSERICEWRGFEQLATAVVIRIERHFDKGRCSAKILSEQKTSGVLGEKSETLRSGASARNDNSVSKNKIFVNAGFGKFKEGNIAATITARDYKGPMNFVCDEKGMRPLLPLEHERLQGFPDNFTRISYRKKTIENCPDGPRYKALGNSWAVPVVRWIFARIEEQEAALRLAA